MRTEKLRVAKQKGFVYSDHTHSNSAAKFSAKSRKNSECNALDSTGELAESRENKVPLKKLPALRPNL